MSYGPCHAHELPCDENGECVVCRAAKRKPKRIAPWGMKNGKFWDERLAENSGTVVLILLGTMAVIALLSF